MHELTHTRQLMHLVPQIKRLQAQHQLPASVNDNLIEETFASNSEYKQLYEQEKMHLSRGVLANDHQACREAVVQALTIRQLRHSRFFVGKYEGWAEMEDAFLALEGAAMWVQFQVARQLAPKGEAWLDTLVTLSQRTDAWSQEEGLGLFLLIDKLVPEWQMQFFASDPPSPFAVLHKAVESMVAPGR